MFRSTPLDVQTEAALLDQVAILGRKQDLRQLTKTLILCRTGQGKAILLTGNEGIGKTALLETFLDLAETAYACPSVTVPWPEEMTAYHLFVQVIQSLQTLSLRIVQEALQEANQVLNPLGLRWAQSDLVQIVALLHLQGHVGSNQRLQVEQVAQVLQTAIPLFRRKAAILKEPIQLLSRLLCDPWTTLAISLLNPVNPRLQKALALVSKIEGGSPHEMRLLPLTSGNGLKQISGDVVLPEAVSSEVASGLTEPFEEDTLFEEEIIEKENTMPKVAEIQASLVDVLGFIDSSISQHSTCFILAFDQWERLQNASPAIIHELKEFMAEVLRQTVEQRGSQLMVILSGRSEAESYVLGGRLFNALKVKYLVSPLPVAAQEGFLRSHFARLNVQFDETVLKSISMFSAGNPAWLTLMVKAIEVDVNQSGLSHLTQSVYEERYAVQHPEALLELIYTRLQFSFVGEETAFLKILERLVSRYANTPFKKAQFLKLLSQGQEEETVLKDLLDALFLQGFVVADEASVEEQTYRFYTPFALQYLQEKVRPLQSDLPAQDKIASLKKVLPLSIQSGEWSAEKTREILSMSAALENDELSTFVEETLLQALAQPALTVPIKITILESLSFIPSASVFTALVKTLTTETDETLRQVSAEYLNGFMSRNPLLGDKTQLLEMMLPFSSEDNTALRVQAYRFLSQFAPPDPQVLKRLLAGVDDTEKEIQALAFAGLSRYQPPTPEILALYYRILASTDNPAILRAVLRGLQTQSPQVLVGKLDQYLESHAFSPIWMEVMSQLMQLDWGKALPWVLKVLKECDDESMKLSVLKRLGTKMHPDTERILIQTLAPPLAESLQPEVRWVIIRSLGKIGQSADALSILEDQKPYCQQDDILALALDRAIRHVSERLPQTTSFQMSATMTNDWDTSSEEETLSYYHADKPQNGKTDAAHQTVDLVISQN